MFNITPNNTQQPVTPYALGLTPEQLEQMNDPNKGITEFAKALAGGVSQYNNQQQQQNALKVQQLNLSPRPQYAQDKVTGAITPMTGTNGSPTTLPPNADVTGVNPNQLTPDQELEHEAKKLAMIEYWKERYAKEMASVGEENKEKLVVVEKTAKEEEDKLKSETAKPISEPAANDIRSAQDVSETVTKIQKLLNSNPDLYDQKNLTAVLTPSIISEALGAMGLTSKSVPKLHTLIDELKAQVSSMRKTTRINQTDLDTLNKLIPHAGMTKEEINDDLQSFKANSNRIIQMLQPNSGTITQTSSGTIKSKYTNLDLGK